MEVQVALFCFITGVMSQQQEGLVNNREVFADAYTYCDENFNCPEDLVCNENQCDCKRGFQNVSGQCQRCPGPGSQCVSCCFPPDTYECSGSRRRTCVCKGYCFDLVTFAVQFAVGAFLIFFFGAIVALSLKACQGGNGSRGQLSESPRQRESSLTSVQRFVLRRLRDRPPRYEDTNPIRLEKPPPYQEGVPNCEVAGIWSTPPPLYSEALHSATSSTVNEDNKPEQQAHVSMVSDTRTEGEGENGLSHSCQLRGADSIRSTPHADRQTQRSESELHM